MTTRKRITKKLQEQAKVLANRPYHVVITEDVTLSGKQAYTVKYLEMPHCLGQGETVKEALADLKDAAYEYILNWLLYDVPVPDPYAFTDKTLGGR